MKSTSADRIILAASLLLNAYLIYVGIRRTGDINSFATTQRIVGAQLFLDSLKEDNIDILVLPPAALKTVTFQGQGYSIRIRPLCSGEGRGCDNFIGLYHSLVLDFACFKWNEDRKLSLVLIKTLARVHRNANLLMQAISEKGMDHPDVIREVENYALIFERHYGERYNQIEGVIRKREIRDASRHSTIAATNQPAKPDK